MGAGRTDTFNPNKAIFNLPLGRLPEPEKNAAVNSPSNWLHAAATSRHAAALGR